MRKLYSLAFCLLFAFPALASHYVGGQITATQLNMQYGYNVSLKLYKDAAGIPGVGETLTIVDDQNNSTVGTFTIRNFVTTVAYADPTGRLTINLEQYDTLFVFPGPGRYRISWTHCCRTGTVINLQNPSSVNAFLETVLTVDSGVNSTPDFLSPPSFGANLNTLWNHAPAPMDMDGDSLVWTIGSPLTTHNGTAPYTHPTSATSVPFSIDPQTSVINWMPTLRGTFVTSVTVKEYRNGVQIGRICRDYMLWVRDSSSGSPLVTPPQLPLRGNRLQVRVTPGLPCSFAIQASHATDSMNVIGFGEPFNHPTSPAAFSINRSSSSSLTANFGWRTTLAMARTQPYQMVASAVQIRNNVIWNRVDYPIWIEVANAASTKNLESAFEVKAYPNPSSNSVAISVSESKAGSIQFVWTDMTGKVVISESMLASGGTSTLLFTDLPASGIYEVKVVQNGNILGQTKVVVQ